MAYEPRSLVLNSWRKKDVENRILIFSSIRKLSIPMWIRESSSDLRKGRIRISFTRKNLFLIKFLPVVVDIQGQAVRLSEKRA
jgi:hypothetical protein